MATVRNAVISFSILIILIIGMVTLVEVTRRSRQLVTSQMEFIATITHELKTPLAVISSAAQNLTDGLVKDKLKAEQYGQMIKKEATRLSITIEHYLLYSNTNTASRIRPEVCSIAELIQAALKFTEEEREELEFSTEIILPKDPVFVYGDKIALESVFQNIAQNAVRHAAQGKYLGIFVSVEFAGKRKKSNHVVIKFRDRGSGISPQEQKSIFEPFVRGKKRFSIKSPVME
ncbi:sensor histidine kinase [Brucepastera parasyntrophica]|uniref:sensor histidine kinase n=1 Tax=Brucepastera parasyntrophica TaxID=2880008 RepID=UPI00210A0495|nr:HAMP domain-containing sensor histidine kinase [Brucepastera parasyntrophica]